MTEMHPSRVVTEARLRTSVNELLHSFILELAIACRKLSIYSPGHPAGQAAIEKPFVILSRLFASRTNCTLHLRKGQLYVCNITIKESIFASQIMQFMQVLDINALILHRELSAREFGIFLERFVKRMRQDDPNYLLNTWLKKFNVTTIEANTEFGYNRLDMHRIYRGDVDDDFSVRRMALDQLGNDPRRLAEINSTDEKGLVGLGVDYDIMIVKYLLPEKIAAFAPGVLRDAAQKLANEVKLGGGDEASRAHLIDLYSSYFRLIEMHPERDKIVASLDEPPVRPSVERSIDPSTYTGAIKMSALSKVDTLLEAISAATPDSVDSQEFTDAFERLVKTGQQQRAEAVVTQLILLLRDPQPAVRQKALGLIAAVIDNLPGASAAKVVHLSVQLVIESIMARRETYEYSELIWKLGQKLLAARNYELLSELCVAMSVRRHLDGTVTIYDSMAVKKAFESLNHPAIIDRLVGEIVSGEHEHSTALRLICSSIGSEQMAFALSQIITHPNRQVRQQALRIVAELGKASLKVFWQVIVDDTWFERAAERHELPDAKWYTIRNAIFVLGSLRDPEGIIPLRLRLADHDIRVRREIVTALEKIGGPEAVDLLLMMAEDPSKEIAEAAIAAVGVIGTQESVPFLIDIAVRTPQESPRLALVVGKLGGSDAKKWLTGLLADDSAMTELAAGKVAKDDLRLAVVRAVANMGDETALQQIREFHASLSNTSKLFFKNSSLSKTLEQILQRK